MRNIIAIDYKSASSFVSSDNYGLEFKTKETNLDCLKDIATIFKPNNIEEIEPYLKKHLDENYLLISKDHLMSYFGLKAVNVDGLIVLDQHMDIYSYQTHGKELNKANVFRHILDKEIIRYIVFVGIRASEESFHNIPEVEIEDFDKEFSEKYRKLGIHSGLDDRISIIPVYKFKALSEGIKKSLEILREREIKNIGLDIDLDVFDSNIIKGVDYNKNFPKLILNGYIQRKGKKGKEYQEYLDLSKWFSHQISQKGLSIDNIESELKKINLLLHKFNLNYVGITEFEPLNDDGKTLELIKTIIKYMK